MRSPRVSQRYNRKRATAMLRATTIIILLASIDAIPSDPIDTKSDFFAPREDAFRLVKHKRRYADRKHPLLVTKDEDAIVEDNIIVESNVLRLIRPSSKNEISRIKRQDPSLVPHRRVARGWNLQYAVVPQQYVFYPPTKTSKSYKKKNIGYRYY